MSFCHSEVELSIQEGTYPRSICIQPTTDFSDVVDLSKESDFYGLTYSPEIETANDAPIAIATLDGQENFGATPTYVTDNKQICIKPPGSYDFFLPHQLSQMEEVVQIVCNTQALSLPDHLYKNMEAGLAVRCVSNSSVIPAQHFHRDPKVKEVGELFHVFSVANRDATEWAKTDNPEPENIIKTTPYELNFMSMACLHRRPEIPLGAPRVVALVTMSLSATDMHVLTQEFGVSKPVQITRRIGQALGLKNRGLA